MKSAILAGLTILATTVSSVKVWHLPANDAPSPIPKHLGNSTFDQLIDHKNPSLGTFKQFYFYDTTYYKGPGSPIVLFTPGEVNVSYYTDYLTTARTTGVVAKKIGAATIAIEHRYWGTSTPFTDLTTANLTYLTLENAIADFTYFAQTVDLPFANGKPSNGKDVPWLFMGGSYSGALAAWTASVSPGTFWAYLASSAPVQAISNYYGYFLPVQEGMPKNCSKDVSLVVSHLDQVMQTGTASEIKAMKAKFGLESLEHNDDFMSALENGPWLWQGNQFYRTTGFYTWCDYVENAVNETDPKKIPGAEGVGLHKALDGYARWAKDYFFPDYCYESYGYYKGASNFKCLNTYDTNNKIFTDTSLGNTGERQWTWMLCNQPFGYWQTGSKDTTIVSELVNAKYWIRQCANYFPTGPNGETYGIKKGITEADVNKYTGGWNIDHTTRLIYTNGGFDPWREASVSSDLRPNGRLMNTTQVPVNFVPGGFHTSDLVTENGIVNAGAKAAIDREVDQLVAWVNEFPSNTYTKRSARAFQA